MNEPTKQTTDALTSVLESCDLGDHNNRPHFHAHDECYVLSPRTAQRMAPQILAALTAALSGDGEGASK